MLPELGKYAGTVLSAYGVTILLVVGLIWVSLRASSRAKDHLATLEARRNEARNAKK